MTQSSKRGATGLADSFRAYADLNRLHFLPAWPLIFCSGLFLGFAYYGGFSWMLVAKAVLIAVFGFQAGLILNDYVDRNIDERDVDESLTGYWRPFKKRPIPAGLISPGKARGIFIVYAVLAIALIASIPAPNSLYILIIMIYSYCAEYFYQVKKRSQRYPLAQLLGRTDFALFPVAGYLCVGQPDHVAVLYFLFFYPLAIAHLGVNDLADYVNDRARRLKTIPVLYGVKGTMRWIILFMILHYLAASVFLKSLGKTAGIGFVIGFILLFLAVAVLKRDPTPRSALRVLPVYHATMALYSVSIIADYFIG